MGRRARRDAHRTTRLPDGHPVLGRAPADLMEFADVDLGRARRARSRHAERQRTGRAVLVDHPTEATETLGGAGGVEANEVAWGRGQRRSIAGQRWFGMRLRAAPVQHGHTRSHRSCDDVPYKRDGHAPHPSVSPRPTRHRGDSQRCATTRLPNPTFVRVAWCTYTVRSLSFGSSLWQAWRCRIGTVRPVCHVRTLWPQVA